ncbi:MAG: polymer-forming cytoskeletal protein [Pseudobdellovibrionaceae bacterium]|nr:polymer-forming cytoskeletal protein [Pseudobdellovibrionaceae bacterium]
MFNPQKKGGAGPGKKDHPKDYAVTIITSGCHFSGKLYCKGSTRIGGKVDGEIVSEGLLIIEEEAMISAEVKAEDIVIQGHLRGTVEAHGKVELSPTCVFEGDIITPVLVVQEGAQFNGRTTMDPNRIMDRQGTHENSKTYTPPYLGGAIRPEELTKVDLAMNGPEISANL